MKKTVAAFLMLSISLSVILSGCGNSGSDSNQNVTASPGNSGPSTTPQAANGKQKLVFWTWYPSQATMDKIEKQFEAENPDIDLEIVISPTADYDKKIPVGLASGEQIDVFGVKSTSMIKQLEAYSENMSEWAVKQWGDGWESKFVEATLKDTRLATGRDDNLTTLPLGQVSSSFFYYNKTMFDELGLKAPATMDEFEALAKALKEKKPDVIPVAANIGEAWGAILLYQDILAQKYGEKFTDAQLGKAKFTDPEFKEAAVSYKNLFDRGILTKDVLDLSYAREIELFNTGKAAMYLDGNWAAYNLNDDYRKKNNIDVGEVGVFMLPPVEGAQYKGAQAFTDVLISINKNSEVKDAAAKFVEYMTQGKGQDFIGNDFALNPSKKDFTPDESQLATQTEKDSFQFILDASKNNNGLRYYPAPQVLDPVGQALQSYFAGGDIDDALARVQDEFDKQQ